MIRIDNVVSLIDVSASDISEETLTFFKTVVGRTYSDQVLHEDIYGLEIDKELFQRQSEIVIKEVNEIILLAEEKNAGYVRFIFW